MNNDLERLSEAELANVIANAQRALKEKQHSKRKGVIAQIKELAASIGVSVEITDGDKPVSSRRGSKVAPKYRNPNNHNQTWTGRGMKPRWLQALIQQGRHADEFLI
ncbi:MAG: H-NS histone family protein [Methylococcaceae bacterium]|jgi:DNA-binding protein H-NS|nr:H-NS histone family protein [Methylococcaceae bacterium]